jgi:5-hydroxyisourate hydrolase
VISLSTHVLDLERGVPARGVRVELWQEDLVAAAETDGDGRIAELAADLQPGTYRIFFRPRGSPFFKGVGLEVELAEGHYHVPLLVSSYGCTTYRGS